MIGGLNEYQHWQKDTRLQGRDRRLEREDRVPALGEPMPDGRSQPGTIGNRIIASQSQENASEGCQMTWGASIALALWLGTVGGFIGLFVGNRLE